MWSTSRACSRETFTAGMLVVSSIAAGALLLGAQRSAQALRSPSPSAATGTSDHAAVWKSQTTGNQYRVQFAGETFRADWINLPTSLARHGAYIHTECRRVGNKWVGTSSSYLPCSADSSHSNGMANWCKLVTRTEIDTVAADRITGRGQGLKRFDCKACRILEADWKDFVWVPAK